MSSAISLPAVPAKHRDFRDYIKSHPKTPIEELVRPYNEYDSVLRQVFAQEPTHPAVADNHVNVVPLYGADGTTDLGVRARDRASESNETKEKYIMPLKDEDRRPSGSPAVVPTLKEFQNNFSIFSEGSLSGLDWRNVVVSGSAVVTCLLPLEDKYRESKRLLRQYYHQEFAPASDVDLFIYGLNEEQAIEKIKHIEEKIKDCILHETTTVRTKNTIMIVSQYPTRHVQIVLRVYKSIAEILTGFDVDCSCAAYDGENVFVAPRAAASYITQINRADLTRRSPSYENRLSKYSRRGFEIFWPQLDRSRIDPTIFERSFSRTVGLARLLILEKLPTQTDREEYLQQRRAERGRPQLNTYMRNYNKLSNNIKDAWEDEVAEWDVEDENDSNYHTFSIPYGEKYQARKIEKLLYKKDLLLNAEWNNGDREVNLHRHPAFFGDFEDVVQDCCGFCPKPVTPEEQEVWEKESKIYISSEISFTKDDPGRQEIGSFHPITDDDWTEMAYVGDTAGLCQAIVDHELGLVKEWLAREGADPNRRDYTGRTPLHLAAMASTPDIVQCLVDHGARLIARLADGQTALHLAAARGSVEIVRILLTKSEENEEAEEEKKDQARGRGNILKDSDEEDEDLERVSNESGDADAENVSFATGSFVNVKKEEGQQDTGDIVFEDKADGPDIYNINVVAWDNRTSPLHLAIINGHTGVVEELVSSFGADVLLPITLLYTWGQQPRGVILSLALSLRQPPEKATTMIGTLLRLGATPAQADQDGYTPLHYVAASPHPGFLHDFLEHDEPGFKRAIDHVAISGAVFNPDVKSALGVAIDAGNDTQAIILLEAGAARTIDFKSYLKSAQAKWSEYMKDNSSDRNEMLFYEHVKQPIIVAAERNNPVIARQLLREDVDPNTLTPDAHRARLDFFPVGFMSAESLLDIVELQIAQLQEYTGERVHDLHPIPLNEDDQHYLEPYQEGTYQMFVAKDQLRMGRISFNKHLEEHKKALKKATEGTGVDEKRRTIEALIREYQGLKAELLAKGAKTFRELYPENVSKQRDDRCNDTARKQPDPFGIEFSFRAPDLTGEKRDGYIKLFEAAWSGDLDTIKSLTLGMWGPNNEEPPLVIATADFMEFSPYSLAVLRGHLDVAKAVLEIVQAQYKPPEAQGRRKFNLQTSDDDSDYISDDESSDNEIRIRSEVIKDEFTVDNIGEVSAKAESDVTPLRVYLMACEVNVLASDGATAEMMGSKLPYRKVHSLIEFSIYDDNVDLLIYLLELGQTLTTKDTKNEDDSSPIFVPTDRGFRLAVELGRLRCLTELIRRTGVGLPLDKLVEQSGGKVKRKPKYYQGLSIHGKKRTDWAAAPGSGRRQLASETHPPLLLAAVQGSLTSVEWFLSTAPGRYYTEFARAHKHDKRLKALARTERGVEECIVNWLGLRNNLVLHCAVLSQETDESVKLVEYLVKTVPDCLDVKSVDGYTPLALAFYKHRGRFARMLVDAGANQTARDNMGNNILHLLLWDAWIHDQDLSNPLPLLDLLDRRLVSSLLTERSSGSPGSLTPLARWLHRIGNGDSVYENGSFNMRQETDGEIAVLRMLLDFAEPTDQKHLELLDGAGNTPVHDAVRLQLPTILELMLERRPDLVERENASGCTPADLAKAAWVAEATHDPPYMPRGQSESHFGDHERAREFIKRSPDSFAPEKNNVRTEREDIKDLCMKTANKESSGCKRKLVTLFDANEVARRLAMQSKRRDNWGNREQSDEVSGWC